MSNEDAEICNPGCIICKGADWKAYRPHTFGPDCWCASVEYTGKCEMDRLFGDLLK